MSDEPTTCWWRTTLLELYCWKRDLFCHHVVNTGITEGYNHNQSVCTSVRDFTPVDRSRDCGGRGGRPMASAAFCGPLCLRKDGPRFLLLWRDSLVQEVHSFIQDSLLCSVCSGSQSCVSSADTVEDTTGRSVWQRPGCCGRGAASEKMFVESRCGDSGSEEVQVTASLWRGSSCGPVWIFSCFTFIPSFLSFSLFWFPLFLSAHWWSSCFPSLLFLGLPSSRGLSRPNDTCSSLFVHLWKPPSTPMRSKNKTEKNTVSID